MLKDDLRENGFSMIEHYPKSSRINALWVFLTLFLIILSFGGLIFFWGFVMGGLPESPDDIFIQMIETTGRILTLGMLDTDIAGYFIFAVLTLFLYLFLKLFMTILFCHQPGSIKMKILEKGMPVCHCKEALKVWQNVLIYFVPFILNYALYIFLCVRYSDKAEFMIMLFILLFFLAFDLTAVICVLFYKGKYRIDYISLDRHIYEVTLFRKAYIKFNKKSANKLLKNDNDKYVENGKFKWRKNKNKII